MKKLFEGIKDRKFLFFAVIISAVLATAVFLFSVLFNNKKQQENLVAPAAPKEKTMEEVVEDLKIPVTNNGKINTISNEEIKSLSVPVTNDGKINSVSGEQIKSLSVPIN